MKRQQVTVKLKRYRPVSHQVGPMHDWKATKARRGRHRPRAITEGAVFVAAMNPMARGADT